MSTYYITEYKPLLFGCEILYTGKFDADDDDIKTAQKNAERYKLHCDNELEIGVFAQNESNIVDGKEAWRLCYTKNGKWVDVSKKHEKVRITFKGGIYNCNATQDIKSGFIVSSEIKTLRESLLDDEKKNYQKLSLVHPDALTLIIQAQDELIAQLKESIALLKGGIY